MEQFVNSAEKNMSRNPIDLSGEDSLIGVLGNYEVDDSTIIAALRETNRPLSEQEFCEMIRWTSRVVSPNRLEITEYLLSLPESNQFATSALKNIFESNYFPLGEDTRFFKICKVLLEKGADPNALCQAADLAQPIVKEIRTALEKKLEIRKRRISDQMDELRANGEVTAPPRMTDLIAQWSSLDPDQEQGKAELARIERRYKPRLALCKLSLLDIALRNKSWNVAGLLREHGASITPNGVDVIFSEQDPYACEIKGCYVSDKGKYPKPLVDMVEQCDFDLDQFLLMQITLKLMNSGYYERAELSSRKITSLPEWVNFVRAKGLKINGEEILHALKDRSSKSSMAPIYILPIVLSLDPKSCSSDAAHGIVHYLEKKSFLMKKGVFNCILEDAKAGSKGHLIPNKQKNPINFLGFFLAAHYALTALSRKSGSVFVENVMPSESCRKAITQMLYNTGFQWQEIFPALCTVGLEAANDAKDYVDEFMQYVVIPAAFSRIARPMDKLPRELILPLVEALKAKLEYPTTAALAGNKGIVEFVEGSERWHERRAQFIMAHENAEGKKVGLRDVPMSGNWHLLIPQKTIQVPKSVCPSGVEIINLDSAKELQEEHKALGHCIDGYDNKCKRGKAHILSIRSKTDTRTHSTVEIHINNGQLKIFQHQHTREEKTPNQESQAAINWFLGEVKAKRIEVNLNVHGEIKAGQVGTDLLSYFGYMPTPENLERAFSVFKSPELRALKRNAEGVLIVDDKGTQRSERPIFRQKRHGHLLSGMSRTSSLEDFLNNTGLSQAIDEVLREYGLEVKKRYTPRAGKFDGRGLA